jgi:hypothetical protein
MGRASQSQMLGGRWLSPQPFRFLVVEIIRRGFFLA